jgi:GntR family transcriptional repressor for pyruvate dehydrogenase complex
LEGYAAKQAAKQMSHVELDKLKKLDDRLQLYASRNKYNDYIEKNVEFHRLITNLSGNGHVAKLVTELRMRIYRYRLMSVTIPGYLSIYASQHKKIIDALGERNSVLARKYMEEHVTFVQDILVKFLKENMNL